MNTHRYVFSELDVPNTEMVAELERTLGLMKFGDVIDLAKFNEDIGSGPSPQLHDALWLCKHMFTSHTGKLSSRQVLVLTTTDTPYVEAIPLTRMLLLLRECELLDDNLI